MTDCWEWAYIVILPHISILTSMLDFWILGMNARNLDYIKKFNPKKGIRLANDKHKSKQFLSDRWIPVPKTYDLITNRKDLYQYDFSTIPADEFIVKPTQWSRWRWIYRVKPLDQHPEWHGYLDVSWSRFDKFFGAESPYTDQRYKVSGEIIHDNALRRYMVDILDGKNSMNRWNDRILLEELIVPWSGFELFCEHGLADIRVIVFNLVPVAAMLRVPTQMSGGTANLDRWGLWLWVNVSTGKVQSMFQHDKIYKDDFPEEFAAFQDKQISYRSDILLYSSKIQYFANLWYLALDRVITDEWPKILEINARAGLKFQLAGALPIKHRLNKIKDMKIVDPEKGVEIAKTLFTPQRWQLISSSKVIYLSQHGKLKKTTTEWEKSWDKEILDVIVDVDIKRQRTTVGSEVYKFLNRKDNKFTLELVDSHITFKDFSHKLSKKTEPNTIVLGRDLAQDYYLKPIKKVFTTQHVISNKNLIEHEIDKLHILDEKLFNLGKTLNLSRILKPTNYLSELDNFITRNGHYNPKFEYNRPSDKKLHSVHNQIRALQEKYFDYSDGLKSNFAKLFMDKTEELIQKHDLVVAYKQQKYRDILVANQKLYGTLDEDYVKQSKWMVFEHENEDVTLWREIRSLEIKEYILSYLKQQWYTWVQVIFDSQSTARLTVARTSKNIVIKIKQWAVFGERDLKATLAHEIDVHVRRWMNGVQSGWHILRNGTAHFLADEEWLAVIEWNKYLPEDYVKKWMYYKYYLLSQTWKKDFAYLAGLLRSLREATLRQSFNGALRLKRWIQNTGYISEWALNYSWKVYLDGFKKANYRIASWWDPEDLMLGKVKIGDLKFI